MPQAELTTRIKVLATIGVMLALLLAALDQTIVGTALPRIVAELNGLDRYSWLITGYLVASTVVIPISGKLGDLFGRKPFLIAGMVGFVAASALCGVAQSMLQLTAPDHLRGRVVSLYLLVFGGLSPAGSLLAGWLADVGGTRLAFLISGGSVTVAHWPSSTTQAGDALRSLLSAMLRASERSPWAKVWTAVRTSSP